MSVQTAVDLFVAVCGVIVLTLLDVFCLCICTGHGFDIFVVELTC